MDGMKIVESVRRHPACCPITGRHEDPDGFVQTELRVRYQDARFTPAIGLVKQLAETIGWIPGQQHDDEVARLATRIEVLEEELAASQADLDDYDHLRRAVATTLRDGAVVKGKLIEPRPAGRAPRSLDELTALQELRLKVAQENAVDAELEVPA
jgi:hypothetical protein